MFYCHKLKMSAAKNNLEVLENSNCVICKSGIGEVRLSQKGLYSLIGASQKRGDGLHHKLSIADKYCVHEKCRKSYTAAKSIAAVKNTVPSKTRILRTCDSNFDYQTHCLICGKEIDFENLKRHPERCNSVSSVEIINKFEKNSLLQATLLETCSHRCDDQASEVKARISCVGDIRAVDAKYHRKCLQMFLSGRGTGEIISDRKDSVKNGAFHHLCNWLSSEPNSQFSLIDLQEKMSTFLPEDVEPYSVKHLQRRLQDNFGLHLTFSQVDGKATVLTFKREAASILHDAYDDITDTSNCDVLKKAKELGLAVRASMENLKQPEGIYPSPQSIEIDDLEKQVPQVLLTLVQNMMGKTSTVSAFGKQRLEVVSLCHALMQASARKPYVSPLLLTTGLFIHQTTRSRLLLNVLSALGLTVSYDHVMDFEKSAVMSESIDDLPTGISTVGEGGGICQWIADNFDHNEDTITGKDSTHVMGVIACQTPSSNTKVTVKRVKKTSKDIASCGDFGCIIKPYVSSRENLMAKVVFKPIEPIKVLYLDAYKTVDTLWMLSNARAQVAPSWQGFMSEIVQGHFLCSAVVYHPMIPLNPQTTEAVYSTMVFVDKQRLKVGQCCAMLTFDQALYAKAYKIKADNPVEFKHIQLRLGGFHQLMSFLSTGCKAMEGSGLEEVWASVYARNSVSKMFEGKCYTKTLRACLLTSAALHVLIWTTNTENVDLDETSVEDANQERLNDKLLTNLECLSKDLLDHQKPLDDVYEDPHVSEMTKTITVAKKKYCNSRTAKLWLLFMDFVSTVCLFIRAERTGNWLLHLKSSQDMLSWFAATGHNNYAKYCRLYLQDFINPCLCLKDALSDGLFTIHRNNKMFWSGTWTDMVIEQTLMRSGKTQGGLINITHREAARTKWLLSAHVVAQYTESLRSLTGTCTGTWSEEHREMTSGRIKQDYEDMHTILSFLHAHNPFHGGENSQIRNIATGLIADCRVNVDNLVDIGNSIQQSMTNKSFGSLTMKRSRQVVTFAVMKKAITLLDGDKIHISSAEIYQRLLAIAYVSGPPHASVFSFELAAVSPALFHDDGSMRKTQKSQLAKYITDSHPAIVICGDLIPAVTVIDGCAVLQKIKWPKVGTLHDMCLTFTRVVQQKGLGGFPVLVVFDSYNVHTTKEQEQKRRRLMKLADADVVVEKSTPVPSDPSSFLANKKNKQNIINLLSTYLQDSDISVEHAGNEGDADVVIAREVLQLSKSNDVVHLVCDDTDILILLMYHADPRSNIFMTTLTHTISIRQAQLSIGAQFCKLLPFLHAMSGCDTTSSVFGYGKIKHFKYLLSSAVLQEDVKVFGDETASLQDIAFIGEKYMAGLFSNGNLEKSLDELRYLSIISTRYVPIERIPPTSRACYFHSLRVHHQVSTWRSLKTVLDRDQYGFITKDGEVVSVITDKPPAPPELLKEIRCSCKNNKNLCSSCSCYKRRIPCSIHCKCEGMCQNGICATLQ